MHRKDKGSIGELAVAQFLLRQGFPCFTELGDNSKVDLIALIDNMPILIQVKARKIKNGSIQIKSSKSAKGYSYKYQTCDFDVLAVYSYEIDDIGFVSAADFCSFNSMSFRVMSPKNNQKTKIRLLSDYSDIRKALVDYRPRRL